jgi:hypothetical protein
MNKLSTAKRVQIVKALVEGNSLRSVTRMVGVSINTVTKLLVDLGIQPVTPSTMSTCATCQLRGCKPTKSGASATRATRTCLSNTRASLVTAISGRGWASAPIQRWCCRGTSDAAMRKRRIRLCMTSRRASRRACSSRRMVCTRTSKPLTRLSVRTSTMRD